MAPNVSLASHKRILVFGFIGLKMIYEALFGSGVRKIHSFSYPVHLALTVAISRGSLCSDMELTLLVI